MNENQILILLTGVPIIINMILFLIINIKGHRKEIEVGYIVNLICVYIILIFNWIMLL